MLEIGGSSTRYEVLRRIGAGGMGVVYEAEDKERGQKVALKTISNPNADKIHQLKREFRHLAELSHPNLVALYDLFADAGACFFTMELLDGVDLTAYLWDRTSVREDPALAETRPTPLPGTTGISGDDPTITPIPASPCNIKRLRAALPQLALGLHALHAAGKIHRDVKPSNIRVTDDARVVLLDFGLVAELDRKDRGAETGLIVGTVAYMAPEQCAGDVALTPAADWYALGVVLFYVLTGRFPFDGPPARVILDKQTKPALRPSMLCHDVPKDLDELCAELMEREPTDRPSGIALLRRLGVETDSGRMSTPSLSRDTGFAGRDAEMALLEGALEPLANKRASVALVRAPSGLGKSTLVAQFFERVRATHDNALLLRGRCLEREDVPYKAIDHLIDELSDWWLELPPKEAQSILPRDAHLLPTLFPVLDRVPAIADAPRSRAIADPQARRTLAFDALRETLQRLGDRRTVVLFLDDMQWVDRDTTALLADLMRAPDPPPILLVLATRVDGSEPVVELVERMDAVPTFVDVQPLSEDAALRLAMTQLENAEEAKRLVEEADGSPLFLLELTRYLQGRSLAEIGGKGLDAMLAERIDELGESGRLIAEVVAVCGEPLTRRLLAAATAIPGAELSRQLANLRAQRVVKTSGSRADDTIEPYHDRVRLAVTTSVPAERRAKHHRALATSLSGKGTAAQLARHWYGAGDLDHAAGHARKAGDEARAKLDFDLCGRWYAIALEGTQWNDTERRELRTQLGDALSDAGRPYDASQQFLAATEGADKPTALELRRRAAGSLLQSGFVREGLDMTREVLAGVGLRMPRSPLRALIGMLVRRAWLYVRGLGYTPRSLSEISQAELTRVDLCESTSFAMIFVDSFRCMDFGIKFLHAALRLGERWRVSRGLALETDFLAASAKTERAERLLARLAEMTPTLDQPPAKSQLISTRGFVELFVHNRFARAYDLFTQAISEYRAVVGRAGFELDTVVVFSCISLYYMGEIGELSRRVPAIVEAATRNGNRFTAITLRCAFPLAWHARLEPDEIEQEIDSSLASWSTVDGMYQLQHLFALCSRIDLSLYRRDPRALEATVEAEMKPIKRALLDVPPLQGVLLRATLARHQLGCAVAAQKGSTDEKAALARARKYVKKLGRGKIPLWRASSLMLDGAIHDIAGDTDTAVARYRASLVEFEACETVLFANAVRYRLGALIKGSEGDALVADARAWLERENVRDPDGMLAMLLPVRQ